MFSLVLEIAIRRSKVETQGRKFDKCRQIMAYAEDVVVLQRKLQEVKKCVRHWWSKQIRWD
jgi:hypothetical protein